MSRADRQKNREVADLNKLFWSINAVREDWLLLDRQRERPDFALQRVGAEVVGIELTDLIESTAGQSRSQDTRVLRVIEAETKRMLATIGARGAIVFGNNTSVPEPNDDLEEFRGEVAAFLKTHAGELASDGQSIDASFSHEWGEIETVCRSDAENGVDFIGQHSQAEPAYKTNTMVERTLEILVARIMQKARKRSSYDWQEALWLGLMNKNEPVYSLPAEVQRQAVEAAGSAFNRIILCNCPYDVLDPRPVFPTAIDVLTGEVMHREP